MQRLGLARAIYGLPKLVVLDEPNANLDIAGDAALADVITHLRNTGSTVIVMAHRPSVLQVVNKLMILNAGKVGAFGDRDILLADDYKVDGAHPMAPPVKADRPADLQPLPHVRSLKSETLAAAKNTSGKAKPKVVRMAGPITRRRQA